MPSRRLIHPYLDRRLASAPPVPQWPSFTGVSTYLGSSPSGKCDVYYDASLGAPCLQNAVDLLKAADDIAAKNDAIFGSVGGSVSVIVFALSGATDGTGGADHMGCDYQTGAQIEVCASFGQSERVIGLFEAELSECSMNNQLCGLSTGEALSRWCAMAVSNNALSDFATAPTWFVGGMPNFVDSTDPTDRNPDSTGCGMAFLSWVMSDLFNPRYSLSHIAHAMVALGDGGTLAGLYTKLVPTPAAQAWTDFQAAIAGLPYGVMSDDPFGAPGPAPPDPPAPPVPPDPPTPPTPTSTLELSVLVTSACLGALNRHDDEPTLKAEVQAILDAN